MWITNPAWLLLLAAAASATAVKVLSQPASILADGSTNLAFSLYQNVAKDKSVENILISPVVVASSLGLLALGGKGSTASQVKSILSAATVKDEQLHSALAELLTEVSNPKTRNVTWKISNRLYGPSSATFLDGFIKSSKAHYKCDHSKLNFSNKKSAIKSINQWAANSTEGRLPEVTKDVESGGAMIVNAMVFKRKSRNMSNLKIKLFLKSAESAFTLLFYSVSLRRVLQLNYSCFLLSAVSCQE